MAEAYLEPCQTSKMEHFGEMVNGQKPLIIFAKHSILDVGQDSKYAYVMVPFLVINIWQLYVLDWK